MKTMPHNFLVLLILPGTAYDTENKYTRLPTRHPKYHNLLGASNEVAQSINVVIKRDYYAAVTTSVILFYEQFSTNNTETGWVGRLS